MENQLECRTLRLEDQALVEELLTAIRGGSSDPEAVFLLWKSSFREESLIHYLGLNWCFGCFKGDTLVGVALLQPILFYSGLTQVLWVEALEGLDEVIKAYLLEVSYKTAREKHLQALVFSEQQGWTEVMALVGLKPEIGKHNISVKTAVWS